MKNELSAKTQIKILVTGGGGFLGKYIIRDLLLDGNYEVYSFSRTSHFKDEPLVKEILGDLHDFNSVKTALTGIQIVIHTASKVGMWGEYKSFYETNVIGTENILKAMKLLHINKLIYTSTPSVVFSNKNLINENELLDYPNQYFGHYAKTKSLAEKKVLEASSDEFKTITIRPHLIFGPNDPNLIPRVLEKNKKNQLRIIGNGKNKVDVTYVENASFAHILAVKKLDSIDFVSGNVYFLGDGPVYLWEFINNVLTHFNQKSVTKKIPFKFAYFLGSFFESFFALFSPLLKNYEPPMTRFVAMQLGFSHYFSHDKIKNDLGYSPKFSIEEGIKQLK